MKRSPAAAFWLSVIPGAGHVYVGQPLKGLVLILLVASSIHLADRGTEAFGIVVVFLWIFAMIDAHRSAVEVNHMLETGGKLPGSTETLPFNKWWGWILIAVGVLFTLDNLGWFDIDWIWDLWPLGLIALGLYILRRPTPVVAPNPSASNSPADVPTSPPAPPVPTEASGSEPTAVSGDEDRQP